MPPLKLILVLAVIAAVAIMLRSPGVRTWVRLLGEARPGKLPYKARPYLLSRGEEAFYHTLRHAVGGKYAIAMKVRLADVLTCFHEPRRAGYHNRINQKHLDFVLCDPQTTKIIAGVELDDRSHSRGDRIERDAFLNAAMQAAGIPLIRFRASSHYDSRAVAATLTEVLAPATASVDRGGLADEAGQVHSP